MWGIAISMRATIVSLGSELLFGQIVNTNAAYISAQLQDLGADVLYHYTVGDNPKRMRETMRLAADGADLIITTGGLGPTEDDITKEVICEIMDEELVLDEKALSQIESFFKKTNRTMTQNNKKQAYVPKSCLSRPYESPSRHCEERSDEAIQSTTKSLVLYNEAGTAPGFILSKNNKTFIALPGPPRELTYLFETKVTPYLQERQGSYMVSKILRFIGVGESALEDMLKPIIDVQTDPTIATYAKEGECTLRISSKRATEAEAAAAVDEMAADVRRIAGKWLYSEDDEELHLVCARILVEKGLTISTAESCTAGLFAATLAEYPGISASLDRGFVTYSNEAKTQLVGVPSELIENHGAVSEQVARAMAEGARKAAGTDIAVSVTGIAGPEGGSEAKPVGTAWMAVTGEKGTQTKLVQLRDRGRNWNRKFHTLQMFALLYDYLTQTSVTAPALVTPGSDPGSLTNIKL
jgi:nicotinamide-nucleotide amidase